MTAPDGIQNGVIVAANLDINGHLMNTDGQLIIGSSAGNPSVATLTAGSGMSITNGHGSISLAASGRVGTIDGDTGSATGTTITFNANSHCGSTVEFSASGSTVDLLVTDANDNTIMGASAGNSSISGNSNTFFGYLNGNMLTSGDGNACFGYGNLASATTASNNTCIGVGNLSILGTGVSNITAGTDAAINYLTSESYNICIGNSGTTGDNNVLRIGTAYSSPSGISKCFIAGIEGVSVSNVNIVTINTSTGQLGSEASVAVANGGTGDTSFTAYAPVCGGTSTTGALQSASTGISTSGYILTSTGGSSLPTFQAAPGPAYSVGTWTPEIGSDSGGGPTVGYVVQRGTYQKIGTLVIAMCDILLNSYTAGAGKAVISNLPFTSANDNLFPSGAVAVSNVTFTGSLCTQVNTGSTYAFFVNSVTTTSSNLLASSAISSTTQVNATIIYTASS